MSAPADPKALVELQAAVDANKKAGDWVTGTLPGSFTPISEDALSPEDVLKLTKDVKLPRRLA